MYWSNISEKGPKSALKVCDAFKSAWKHYNLLLFYVVLEDLEVIKVSDMLKCWEPRWYSVLLKTVL